MTRSRSPIGLDFGEHAVRAVQLERRGERVQLRAANAHRIDGGPAAAADRRTGLIAAGRQALRDRRFCGRSAVVALRLTDVVTRHVRLPTEQLDQASEKIARQVQDQAAEGVALSICPIPVADLFDQGERKREFLCCVATADAIQELLEVTEALGLTPEAIDLEPCAQVRPYLHRAQKESFLHLDIGSCSTRITVVRAGSPALMRTAPIGGDLLVQRLEARLQMDLATILDLGAGPDEGQALLHGAITDALAEPLEEILHRVAAGVRYCGALFQGRAVTLMRVSGAIAPLPGLVPYLGRRIGITAELADPMAGIDASPAHTSRRGFPTGYDTAIGLALRGLEP